ncbi:MAG: hypothetical protein ACJ782_04915, partial [Actinomycetota bacterium]
MAEPTSGRAGPEGPPAAVLERFAAERVARLATLCAANRASTAAGGPSGPARPLAAAVIPWSG